MCEKCTMLKPSVDMVISINGNPDENDKKIMADFVRFAEKTVKAMKKQDETLKMKEVDWEDVRNTIVNI